MLEDYLERSAEIFPEKIALICEHQRISYLELDRASNALANALLDQGIKRHDRVAVFLENSIESVVSIFAILKCGAVFSVLDYQIKSGKLGFILRDCQSRALITDSAHLQTLLPILPGCVELRLVVITDTGNDPATEQFKGRRTLAYRQALVQYPSTQPPKNGIDIDLASLIYTSVEGPPESPRGSC